MRRIDQHHLDHRHPGIYIQFREDRLQDLAVDLGEAVECRENSKSELIEPHISISFIVKFDDDLTSSRDRCTGNIFGFLETSDGIFKRSGDQPFHFFS